VKPPSPLNTAAFIPSALQLKVWAPDTSWRKASGGNL